ncbi:AraC family transcriptional regulator [Fulvivirga sp.]|uniref:helix-turn-helix domain-containing protein n=1 Tax=Fulvivirga sp. TaxID=1931237 RepID=UPI0032EAC803
MISVKSLENATELQSSRRIRKFVLVWCEIGNIIIQVDENEFVLTPNSVITITSGQIHWIKNMKASKGIITEFTFDFFCKDDNDIELVFHNSLFCHFAMNEVIELNQSQIVGNTLKEIQSELDEAPYQYLISIHSRMKLILVEINRQKIKGGGEVWKPDALFLKFLEAVRSNFNSNPKAGDIATMLNTTVSKLNEHAKIHTGRTAQSVIFGLMVSEAKRLFTYEKLSVKETAFSLGFSDPFYFSNFFKKNAGVSPKEYQHAHNL